MLQQELLLKKIADALAVLEISTRNRGILRLYDQHIVAETFVADLLNLVYDYELINLNSKDPKYAATDLGDYKRSLCFQVTYTSEDNIRAKIRNTIRTFIDNEGYKDFSRLKFLFLGPKLEKSRKEFNTESLFQFNPDDDVINLKDLVKRIEFLGSRKINSISDLIDKEFHGLSIESYIQNQSDKEALKIYRKMFNRPALQDRFFAEASYQSFENALTELITLLKKGIFDGKLIVKSIDNFDNEELSEDLDKIYHKIRAIRELYNAYKRSGEIIPEQNQAMFKSSDTYDAFDKLKQDIIDEINRVMIKEKLRPIGGLS